MEKKYFNVELSLKNAELLQAKLYKMGVHFEKSAAGNLYHFEIELVPESKEFFELDAFCCNLPYLNI